MPAAEVVALVAVRLGRGSASIVSSGGGSCAREQGPPPDDEGYTRRVDSGEPTFLSVSLDPNPAIEACKRDVDRTLLRENLRLSTTERVRKMVAASRQS